MEGDSSFEEADPFSAGVPPPSRLDFFRLVDGLKTLQDYTEFLQQLKSLEYIESALPSLQIFIEKCPKEVLKDVEELLLQTLICPKLTGGARKACLSCLKDLNRGVPDWNIFFVVAESLEEPQFHIIRPVLPRVDELLSSVSDGKFEWRWARVLLTRALGHTNGWIRLWAVEKTLEVPSAVFVESECSPLCFLTDSILPALNGNDLFWRLLERGRLHEFIQSFGNLLSKVVKQLQNPGKSIEKLLSAMAKLSCPMAFFFVAKILSFVKQERILEGESVFLLLRNVLSRVSSICFPALRSATSFLIVSTISKMIIWTPETIVKSEIATVTSYFSGEAPLFMEKFLEEIGEKWKEPCKSMEKEQLLKELENGEGEYFDLPDYYKFWWKRAEFSGMEFILAALFSRAKAEHCEKKIYLLKAMLYSPNTETTDIDGNSIVSLVSREISRKTADYDKTEKDNRSREKKRAEQFWHLSLIRKFQPEGFCKLLKDFDSSQNENMTTERLGFLTALLKNLAESWTGNEEKLFEIVKKYAGEDLLATPEHQRSNKEMLSAIQDARIQLYLRFLPFSNQSAAEDIEESISELDRAAGYPAKNGLLSVISSRIQEISDPSLILRAINAAAVVVNEEKKSQNSLPSTSRLFEIATRKNVLENKETAARAEELFGEFCSLANLSLPTALVLTNWLESCEEFLPADWAPEVLSVAVFGPVPKKDNKVLNEAYRWIYEEWENELPKSEFERIHEVVQRARMKAFSVAVRCAARDDGHFFASRLINAIIEKSAALDKSSSKSFGLSLAHRQKTRVVALLLMITEEVLHKSKTEGRMESISAIFEHCLTCVLDPCQQFSIKLVVEWILVRICSQVEEYKEKLIRMEKTLANKRIGSVSSWINVLVHLSRISSDDKTAETLLTAILPWSTAQNFAVRCTAIAGLTLIFNGLSEKLKEKYRIVETVVRFDAEPAGNSKRIIENLLGDFYFCRLNMEKHLDLQTILVELPTKTGLPEEETIPLALITTLNRTFFRSKNPDSAFLAAPSLVYAALLKNASCAPDLEVENEEEDQKVENQSESLQKKILTKEKKRPEDCSLIVVASLIDKPTNLGGLCRTSEIFGVEKLVIADLLMANDTGFKALSMSSEKWQKLEAVRPDALLPYLESLRAGGYSVIAAEQTTDSIPMHKFRFPKKCVLLMGEEKEGVPTRLLRAVDQTVEIEQLGQTRSLNVHVTAALFISKYTEQILL